MARPQEPLRTTGIRRQHTPQATGPTPRELTNNTTRAMKSRTKCPPTTARTCKVKGTTNSSRSNAGKTWWIRQKTRPACKKCTISNYNNSKNSKKSKCKKSCWCNRRLLINKSYNSSSIRWLCKRMSTIVVLVMLKVAPINLNIVEKMK